MFRAEKRLKLSTSSKSSVNNNKNKNFSATSSIDQGIESDYISHTDLTNSGEDFTLPPVKRKFSSPRHSLDKNKHSFDELHTSSGYSSLTSSIVSPPRVSRSPKKRKHEDTESDENAFYNSYQFVSPLKIPKKERSAKLILKEKSSSENVILSSTPIRNNTKKKLWGKFRSLHPEKFEQRFEPLETFSILPKSTEASFEIGTSFDFTSSFDLSNNEQQDSHIPFNLQQLCTGSMNLDTIVKPQPTETITKSQEQKVESRTSTSKTTNLSTSSRRSHCGRLKLDMVGMLYKENYLAFNKILGQISDLDLLSLSHVSKDYRNMIKSHKTLETKRLNYLKKFQENRENKPSSQPLPKPTIVSGNRKRAFGDVNINHSMQLRSKPPSPPVSPSSRRFHENQKVAQSHNGPLMKCPYCSKPAKINTIQIRRSPRKKKKIAGSILKISSSGRIQKRSKTFLSKPSIDSHSPSDSSFVTFMDVQSPSPSTSSGSPSSDDSCGSGSEMPNETGTYEYGECSGIACSFKFCVKCRCKYHPRQLCKEFSPGSPSRSVNGTVACSSRSLKSLKRLIY